LKTKMTQLQLEYRRTRNQQCWLWIIWRWSQKM